MDRQGNHDRQDSADFSADSPRQTTPSQRSAMWLFVFRYGVLLWGLGTALLYQLLVTLRGSESSMSMMESLAVFPLAGIFWGLVMWYFMRSASGGRKTSAR